MAQLAIFLILLGLLFAVYYLTMVRLKTALRIFGYVVIGILSIAVFLSLLTFKEGAVLSNLGGIVGYKIAHQMITHFGYMISYTIATLFFFFSLVGIAGVLKPRLFGILLGILLLSIFFAMGMSVVSGRFRRGDAIVAIADFISKYLGKPVSAILFFALAIIAIYPIFKGFKLPSVKIPSISLPKPRKRPQKTTRQSDQIEEEIEVVETEQEEERPSKIEEKKSVFEELSSIAEESSNEPLEFGIHEVREESSSEIVDAPRVESPPMPKTEALIPLLRHEPIATTEANEEECEKNARLIEEKLREFNVKGRVVNYYPGPVVTRYEFEPAPGVKLSKIVGLSDDLALRMKSNKIRIIAPLPDKGLIGIEVPNKKRRIVYFKELVEQEDFKKLKSKLSFALGVDTAGFPRYADLAKMPHLLIAGATGSGKSVCINTIITSILFRASYQEVRFLMIDPKRIELSFYEGIPHLIMPVIKERKEAAKNLKKMVALMDLRYKHFARDGVRDIESHNKTVKDRPGDEPLPYVVIIIDEFADLILTIGKEIEEPLAKLAQMARAVGIHLVVATQRPSVDVITGMIKANFPVRIAFKVPSRVDSKTILDEMGAEKLLGMGDMLFIPPGTSEPVRLHGPYISEEETKRISSEITKEYLNYRFKELFGDNPYVPELIDMILHKGFLISLTRSDEPGLKERFEILISRGARVLHLPEEEVRQKLNLLKSTYYPEMKELEDFDLLVDEEATEISGFGEGYDPLIFDAARLVVQRKNASATFLQRRLKIGFARAARIIDQLEEAGIVGPPEGSKPRQVLVGPDELEEKIKKMME